MASRKQFHEALHIQHIVSELLLVELPQPAIDSEVGVRKLTPTYGHVR
jgi:hypothetical protein